MPLPFLAARCALTTPFHPYLLVTIHKGLRPTGGLLSVALSLGSPPPGVTRHRIPVEPGLSSLSGSGKACQKEQPVGPSDALQLGGFSAVVKL